MAPRKADSVGREAVGTMQRPARSKGVNIAASKTCFNAEHAKVAEFV